MRNLHYENLLGKQITLTGSSCVTVIEAAISEGLAGGAENTPVNIFGRPLIRRVDHSIAHAMGLASAGLRTHTMISDRDLASNFGALEESVRNHLGYVTHVLSDELGDNRRGHGMGHRHFQMASETGWIQLVASNAQEIVDYTIVGHRIAELSLTPVMIAMAEAGTSVETMLLPDRHSLIEYLGQADDLIESPTPSQRMIFGKMRRRIPNWFHFDMPTINGIAKSGDSFAFELASLKQYFHSHIPAIIDQAFAEYGKLTGKTTAAPSGLHTGDADYLIIAHSPISSRVASVVQHLRSKRIKAGCVNLNVLRPFPEKAVCELIAGKKGLTILEPVIRDPTSDPPVFRAVQAAVDKAVQNAARKKNPPFPDVPSMTDRQRPVLYSGQYGSIPRYEAIGQVFRNMIADGKRRFYVNIDLAGETSSYPKQQIVQQNIRREYPNIDGLVLTGDGEQTVPADRTFAVRVFPAHDQPIPTEPFENLGQIVSIRWNARGKSMLSVKPTQPASYQMNFTQEAFPYPLEKAVEIDALILTDSVLRNPEFVTDLKKGAPVVILSSATTASMVLSEPLLSAIKPQQLVLHHVVLPKDFAWEDVLTGVVLRFLSVFWKESPDGTKEIERVETLFRGFGETWSETRRSGILLGLSVMEHPANLSELKIERKTEVDLPLAVRRYKDQGPPYTKVSQFYDRYGYFYQNNKTHEIVADPFHALSVMPPATLNFANTGLYRVHVPEFVPERCTACGQCFVYCPHSAIPPLVISVESLLKHAAETSQAHGTPMSELTPPVMKNLGKIANNLLAQNEGRVTLADILAQALNKLTAQMKLDGDRTLRLNDEVHSAAQMISALPVSVTKPFFQAKETRHLFSLAVNPQACTGCGVCADVCPDNALVMTKTTDENIAALTESFRLWEQLPDTPSTLVEDKYQDEDYDPFAAILLSRNFYMSLVGGSLSERGTAEKMVTHLVSAVGESVLQSGVNLHLKNLEKLIADLTERIQSKLREALPTGNLDHLLESLSGQESARLSLDNLIARLGETERFGVVETSWIERLASLIHELKNLSFMLSQGPTGSGRSRFGAVMATSDAMAWTRHFPFNAFTSPVLICDNAAAMEFTWGVLQGHVRQALDNVKLLRRADLETKNQYDPVIHDAGIAGLGWPDLDPLEKSLVPPVFLFVDNGMLSESNSSGLVRLLADDFPVKVFVFDDAAHGASNTTERLSTLMAMISVRSCFVLQSSLATPRHFFEGLIDGLHQPGPAFFRILTPHPQDFHEFSLPSLLALALHSRVFPSLKFKPGAERKYVSTCLDLASNPEQDKDFCTIDVPYRESGEERSLRYSLTYGDWAIRQPEMRSQFTLLPNTDTSAHSLADFLALSPSAREGKTPFVFLVNAAVELEKYAVSREIVRAAEAIQLGWNTIKEIAGLLTPYPLKLKESIEEELTRKHESTIERLKADYEEKLRDQQRTQLEVVKQKLTDKLLALSGHR